MKKYLVTLSVLAVCYLFTACNNARSETPESIAKEWCELNGKVHNAKSDEEREKARDAREKFEKKIEDKYKGNEDMMNKVKTEVEKCEDASEGR